MLKTKEVSRARMHEKSKAKYSVTDLGAGSTELSQRLYTNRDEKNLQTSIAHVTIA